MTKIWNHCIKMREDRWELMLGDEMAWITDRRIGRQRPNAQLRSALDRLIGEGRWIYQTLFTDDVDQDHLALWFMTAEDELTVRVWLALNGA